MDFLIARHIFIMAVATILSFCFVPFFAGSALRFGVLDIPDGDLKRHGNPVPYMGGIAIYSSFLGAIILLDPFEERGKWLLIGMSLLMLVGFIDDLKRISVSRKLLGQLLGVACFIYGGLTIKQTFFASPVNIFLSVFWMLSLINAINLVDIMDGLATTIAMIAAMTFCVIAIMTCQYDVSLLLLAFIGALVGFFWYNKPAAKIYMGDAGSLFVGGFLAAAPLLIKWGSIRPDAYYAAIIIPAIPLIEVACLVCIRSWKGIPFYQGSPHHFAIYLQNKGWSRWAVLRFCGVMGLYLFCVALLYLKLIINLPGMLVTGVIFCITWYIAVFSKFFVQVESKNNKIAFQPAQSIKKQDDCSKNITPLN